MSPVHFPSRRRILRMRMSPASGRRHQKQKTGGQKQTHSNTFPDGTGIPPCRCCKTTVHDIFSFPLMLWKH